MAQTKSSAKTESKTAVKAEPKKEPAQKNASVAVKAETPAQNEPKTATQKADEKIIRKNEKTVKIRVLVRIRADYGAFDKDLVYEVSSEIADRLVKSGRAEKVE